MPKGKIKHSPFAGQKEKTPDFPQLRSTPQAISPKNSGRGKLTISCWANFLMLKIFLFAEQAASNRFLLWFLRSLEVRDIFFIKLYSPGHLSRPGVKGDLQKNHRERPGASGSEPPRRHHQRGKKKSPCKAPTAMVNLKAFKLLRKRSNFKSKVPT